MLCVVAGGGQVPGGGELFPSCLGAESGRRDLTASCVRTCPQDIYLNYRRISSTNREPSGR